MFRAHTPTSRARPRGIATTSAAGANAEAAITPAGCGLTLRRSAGAATPAATRAQAVALMALETRKWLASISTAPQGQIGPWPRGLPGERIPRFAPRASGPTVGRLT